MVVDLPDPAATVGLGMGLAEILPAGAILLLQGDLGSGKTTLVQGLAQGLGISEPVTSPTFALIQEYPEGRIPLYHLDLYRLTPEEVQQLHLETYWQEVAPGIVAIEWPERLPIRPVNYLHLSWQSMTSGRRVTLTAQGTTPQSWLENFSQSQGFGELV
ncbi:tRNA (adenosine(37)-N6)-threonylcarbamoyltransferase complex ATPase subunit type 1 TsaE [Gloeomargarita lithophora]|uniref:tRNA (adenosine(37)-N6)-threonylcarbamoyltransferase complex ATPase subunit type 1 TsaE n=1 Tax=Gloeomargarita lithophora TaxID=1188228 RepID=UPI000A04A325|nr:tRNA (adenosine(37)-N6)-threonylcarbamoyltransferase complex ATPase subunit type 1 TsaE [Gloeomargarita lithophora]